jgi:2-polyprenyl-3-methyl-5-hydroxy-6-metoxy-1,4-benzoquinol methylase
MPAALTRDCPVCGARDALPFLRKLDLQLVRCAACTMVYADPAPASMANGTFYDAAGEEYLAADKLTSDYADVRFARELKLLRSRCPRGSVLDIGCSSGGFLYQLNHRFPGDYQILGTDVATAPLQHAASMGVPIVKGDFLTHSFAQQFDAVTFWAVMEHLFEPRKFLAQAATILKPGGVCIILVPNLDSLAVKLLGAKYRYIFPEHLNYFTARTLIRLVERDLAVESVTTTHFNPLVIAQDFRRGAREVPRAERARLLKRTNAWKQSQWLLPLQWAYRAGERVLGQFTLADNLILIARKR